MTNATSDASGSPLDSLGIVTAPVLVREQALDRLRDAIINGQFAPGTRLIERELCEAMGVSRTSIREVLRQLEAERLIQVEPRKGPTVARVTRAQAQEIYDIRGYLEGLLVQRFIDNANPQQTRQLEALFEEFAGAAGESNIMRAVALMAQFYAHISSVAQAEVVNDILSQLTARVSYLRATSMSQPGRMAKSVEEIRLIVEAIAAGNYAAAQKAAVNHVKAAAAIALSRLPE
ncbi:GntR family transcriptional regulator [Mariluticola halotolerans]|uniref:GntR family transcriptional regulator n=1 Tax=Mariluticola halotolerans TaxID=2909283 RepID=UPI0026E42657|nr:GntR family transcriptional regulator [Mariluticola halotolerans]UJQ96078.1 GntR family transcriptional regulator [Mariluticola halotolerans]